MQEQLTGPPVIAQSADVRARFMTRVYGHLVAGVMGFIALEVFLFSTPIAEAITAFVFDTSWLLILGGFMLVSWMANSVAIRARTPGASYAAYGALVVAQALIFVPLLWIANVQAPGAISTAAQISVVAFIGLSGVAITSSKDFSFLGSLLKWGGIMALIAIAAAVIFGVGLGTWFSVAMIGFAGAAILYDTQKILHSYPADREVAAAMSLFASLALLFWYVLRLTSRR